MRSSSEGSFTWFFYYLDFLLLLLFLISASFISPWVSPAFCYRRKWLLSAEKSVWIKQERGKKKEEEEERKTWKLIITNSDGISRTNAHWSADNFLIYLRPTWEKKSGSEAKGFTGVEINAARIQFTLFSQNDRTSGSCKCSRQKCVGVEQYSAAFSLKNTRSNNHHHNLPFQRTAQTTTDEERYKYMMIYDILYDIKWRFILYHI